MIIRIIAVPHVAQEVIVSVHYINKGLHYARINIISK